MAGSIRYILPSHESPPEPKQEGMTLAEMVESLQSIEKEHGDLSIEDDNGEPVKGIDVKVLSRPERLMLKWGSGNAEDAENEEE